MRSERGMPADAGKLQTTKTLSVHHHICRPKPARKQQGPEPVGAVRERPGAVLRRKRSALHRMMDATKNHPYSHTPKPQLKPPSTKTTSPLPQNAHQQRERARERATGAEGRGTTRPPHPPLSVFRQIRDA